MTFSVKGTLWNDGKWLTGEMNTAWLSKTEMTTVLLSLSTFPHGLVQTQMWCERDFIGRLNNNPQIVNIK